MVGGEASCPTPSISRKRWSPYRSSEGSGPQGSIAYATIESEADLKKLLSIKALPRLERLRLEIGDRVTVGQNPAEAMWSEPPWGETLTQLVVSVLGDEKPWLAPTQRAIAIRSRVGGVWITLTPTDSGDFHQVECSIPTVYSWSDETIAGEIENMLTELARVEVLRLRPKTNMDLEFQPPDPDDIAAIDSVLKRLHPNARLEVVETQGNVSDYERGVFRLHGQLLIEFAKILEVSTDEILGITVKAAPAVKDKRLLRRIVQIDKLPKRDRDAVVRTVDAFLLKGTK